MLAKLWCLLNNKIDLKIIDKLSDNFHMSIIYDIPADLKGVLKANTFLIIRWCCMIIKQIKRTYFTK